MEDTVSVDKYNAMMDTLHEVCEVYKQQRDVAREEVEQYKEWWLQEASKATKLAADLDKAIEYTHDLERENTELNDELCVNLEDAADFMDDDDDDEDMYEDLGTEIIGGPESADRPTGTHSDIVDAVLSSMMNTAAKETL